VSATRLVSYGPDEVDEADDDEDSGESLPSIFNIKNFQGVSCILIDHKIFLRTALETEYLSTH